MNSKQFLVTLIGDDNTRWMDGEEKIAQGLEMLVKTFAHSYARGSVPDATVVPVKLLAESKERISAAGQFTNPLLVGTSAPPSSKPGGQP